MAVDLWRTSLMDEFKQMLPKRASLSLDCALKRDCRTGPLSIRCERIGYLLRRVSCTFFIFTLISLSLHKKKMLLLLISLLKESEFRGSRFTIQRFLLKSINCKTFFYYYSFLKKKSQLFAVGNVDPLLTERAAKRNRVDILK